ncbi:SDR family NAD(P)-dependent oxidoreductase [Nocardia sp. NPDC004604]|uniref:SDR family NAD(P)-dependent oxidoreductase n=1 Tax=Nocardia sp. NPDC004604 TaxID=3157013 RepID=UPI0033A405E6
MSANSSTARTVLVTGVDDRLGFAVAERLIADGAIVIAHVLQKDHIDEIFERLSAVSQPNQVRVVCADFARLSEVDELGRALTAQLPRLDALINTASIAPPQRRTHTEDRHELTFQTDYLSPQRLTMAMAPALAAVRGRVVTVTSRLHIGGNIEYPDLDRNRGIYTPLAVYAQAKLALTMFCRSLAETGPAGLTSVSVAPADFEIDLPQLRSHRTAPLDAAASLLIALSAPTTPVVNSGYYEGTELTEAAALVRNSRSRTRLAAWSNRLVPAA